MFCGSLGYFLICCARFEMDVINGNSTTNTVSRTTALVRINWDGEPSGYAENTDNWVSL